MLQPTQCFCFVLQWCKVGWASCVEVEYLSRDVRYVLLRTNGIELKRIKIHENSTQLCIWPFRRLKKWQSLVEWPVVITMEWVQAKSHSSNDTFSNPILIYIWQPKNKDIHCSNSSCFVPGWRAYTYIDATKYCVCVTCLDWSILVVLYIEWYWVRWCILSIP